MVRMDAGIASSSNGYHKTDKYVDSPVVSWNPGTSDTSSFTGGGGSHRVDTFGSLINRSLSNLVSSAKSADDKINSFATDAFNRALEAGKTLGSGSGSGYTSSARSGGKPQLDYLDAPLAQHYGMDAATAYQEALSNNAVQRHVQDLQNAGLNPVLGLEGNGASVFSGDVMSSGGSGGYGYSGSAASGLSDAVKKGIPDIVGGVVTAIAVSKHVPGASAIGGAAKNVSKGLITAFA